MAKPFTKRVLYDLLYSVRAKSECIYIALGDGRDPAILKPNVEPGKEIQHLFTYFLKRITHDGKTTKEDLVDALRSQVVGHGVLARKLEEDQTITDRSVLTKGHLKYLNSFLHDAIGKLTELAVQLDVDLDPGTVKHATAFDILINEITEDKKVTPKELAAALRSPTVGEGQLAKKIEQEFGSFVGVAFGALVGALVGGAPGAVVGGLVSAVLSQNFKAIESQKILDDALKQGYVLLKNFIALMVGSPGVGKTCLKCLLMGRKPPDARTSTICAEHPIKIRSVSLSQFKKLHGKWKEVSSDKLLPMIGRFIHKNAKKHGVEIPPELDAYFELLEGSTTAAATSSTASSSAAMAGKSSSSGKGEGKLESSTSHNEAAALDAMVKSVLGSLEKLIAGEELTEEEEDELMSSVWIYFTDSGGQPQFHELLPLFIHDVSSVIIVTRLSDRLDDHPPDEYYQDGQCVGKKSLTHLTTTEQIKCLTSSLLSRSSSEVPDIIVVGTHRDKVDECPESIEEKNERLLKIFGSELVPHLMFYEGVESLLFPVNTIDPDDQDRRVAEMIQVAVEKSKLFKEVKVPIWWFILELLIQGLAKKQGKRVLSREQCVKIANTLGFSEKSFNAALEFFNELNIIKYSSALPDVVFVESQVPLDNVSDLIHEGYLLRHGRPPLRRGNWKRFCYEGVVTLEFMDITCKHFEKGIFESPQLLKLLQNQLVVVPLEPLSDDADVDPLTEEYFMPALLDVLSHEELEKHRIFTSQAAPLLFRFPCGCRRAGVFCCLVVHLMKQSKWSIQHANRKLILVSRNCITFRLLKPSCLVTLIDAFYFFEVHIAAETNAKVCQEVCPIIRKEILAGIEAASKKLRYSNDHPELAVFCPCSKCASKGATNCFRHAAILNEDNCVCVETSKSTPLDERQSIWLDHSADAPVQLVVTVPSRLVWKLQGVVESDETSVVVHSSQGQFVEWNGLKLHIHRGSLPEGMNQCTIYIKASLAGEYEIPESSCFVSAIFWLRCEPQCIFTKPITVEIEHCSTKQDLSRLQIVRAYCSQKQLPYSFKPLGGRFDANSSYGAVEINSFSGIGVIENSLDSNRLYYNQIFYCSHTDPQQPHDIHIIFTWKTDAHINFVDRKYTEKGFRAGTASERIIKIAAHTNKIRIDLEEAKWTKVMDGQWEIQPVKPEVTEVELDVLKPDKVDIFIPYCALEARCLCKPFTQLLHEITLLGIECNSLILSYMPPRKGVVSKVKPEAESDAKKKENETDGEGSQLLPKTQSPNPLTTGAEGTEQKFTEYLTELAKEGNQIDGKGAQPLPHGQTPSPNPLTTENETDGDDTQLLPKTQPPNPLTPEIEEPSIKVVPTNIVCTERVTLTVSVPPSDIVTYQWMKDGVDIEVVNGYTGVNNQTLKITSFSLRRGSGHNGVYVCKVTINGHKVNSHPVQLQGFKSMKFPELKQRATKGELTLNLGSILEKYHLHNYKNLNLEFKPASVKCVVDELVVKQVSKHVMDKCSLYLDVDVCDQKTELVRHKVIATMQCNESRAEMRSTMGQTVNTAKQHGTSVVDNKSTTVSAAVKPEFKGYGVGVAMGEVNVAHTRGTTVTKTDEESDGREQHVGASCDLPTHNATTSTATESTEKHSCTLKGIPIPVKTLGSCKEAIKYSIAYTKIGSDEKIPLEKMKSQTKQIGHFLTKDVTGGRDKIPIDCTYTWDVPVLQNIQS